MKTNLKVALSILGTILGGIGVVIILAWNVIKLNNQNNGFVRNIVAPQPKLVNAIEKDEFIDFVSGGSNNRLFFQTKFANQVFEADYNLQNGRILKLSNQIDKATERGFTLDIRYPFVNVLLGNMPGAIRYHLNSPLLLPAKDSFPTMAFTRCVMISPGSYIYRGISIDTNQRAINQLFYKYNSLTHALIKETNISELNNDAGMPSDGLLNYDSKTHLITYSNFYRNKFICMDTNLNLVYTSKTIDTINYFQIAPEAGKISKNTSLVTNTKPKRVINWKSCVSDGLLYNNSKLRADNETKTNSDDHAVIDVYDVKTGKYISSFYVPLYREEKMRDFKIVENRLIAVYKNYIVSYDMTPLESLLR